MEEPNVSVAGGRRVPVSPWAAVAFVGQCFSSCGERCCFSQTLIQQDVTPPSLCVRGFKGAAALPDCPRNTQRRRERATDAR